MEEQECKHDWTRIHTGLYYCYKCKQEGEIVVKNGM